MKQLLSQLSFETQGEGFTDITPAINDWINKNKLSQGILILTLKHTSCSLTINENADPRVLQDLASYMKALVPEEGFKSISHQGPHLKYQHCEEGPDDMPAHIRTALTCSCLNLSIDNQQLVLGTWQAVYLWEHRHSKHSRKLVLHAIGEIENPEENIKSSKTSLIARRNASKLNELVLQNHIPRKWEEDGGIDTDLDLLIDRIHELTSEDDLNNQSS